MAAAAAASKPSRIANQAHIRNFSIIAQPNPTMGVDAGDRIRELTHTVRPTLDARAGARTRGIEASAGSRQGAGGCAVLRVRADGKTYQLHMIDTPGHVDFTYEYRVRWRRRGRSVVVDASQGVAGADGRQHYLAVSSRGSSDPCLNKSISQAPEPERVADGGSGPARRAADNVRRISAKTGDGVTDVLAS